MKKLKILVVPSDRTGVSYYRSTSPHIALQNLYPDNFHVDIDYEPKLNDDEWLKQYDIIHYHRSLGPFETMKEMNAKLKRLGIVSIMDLDDYWAPGTHHPAHHLIRHNKLDEKVLANLRMAEYVTTTTPIFAKLMSQHNKNVFVLPNAIDPTEAQFISNLEPSDRVRIGWLGGSSHECDIEQLKGIANKLKGDKLIDKVQFVLCGFDLRGTQTFIDKVTKEKKERPINPIESVWYRYEKIFTDDYRGVSPEYKAFLMKFVQEEYPNVKNEPYRRVWTKHISSYANNYNLFDISLAPLADNTFNKVKSQLKVIEAGFHHKAIIAQDFGPYQIDLTNAIQREGVIDMSANAVLIGMNKNHKDWYAAIKKLVNNPELRIALQNNLHETVKDTYSIKKISEDRKKLYYDLYYKQHPGKLMLETGLVY